MRASVARLKHPGSTGSDPSRLALRTGPAAPLRNSPAHTVDCLCHLSASRIRSGSPQIDDTRPPLHADAIERFCNPPPNVEPRTSEGEDFSVHPSLARASATAGRLRSGPRFAGVRPRVAHISPANIISAALIVSMARAVVVCTGADLSKKDRRSP